MSEREVVTWTAQSFRAQWDGMPRLFVLLPFGGADHAAVQVYAVDDTLLAEFDAGGFPEAQAAAEKLAAMRAACELRGHVDRLHLHAWLSERGGGYVEVAGVVVAVDLLRHAAMIIAQTCELRASEKLLWLSDGVRECGVMATRNVYAAQRYERVIAGGGNAPE